MIVAKAHSQTGAHFLILGLTSENVKRLIDGEPIRLTRATHGEGIPEGLIIGILYGADQQAILDQLKASGALGNNALYVIDQRLK